MAAAEHDGHLEDLFASYVERLNAGEELDPEEILAEDPVFGADIVEYLEEYAGFTSSFARGAGPLGTLGDYTLRRQIGRGGMGVVYEAWQGSLDRQVALKVLPAGLAADSRAFLRFMREAKTAAQLSHPSIVAVHGMGVERDTPWYAMELVQGETLAEVLRREPPAPEVFQAHCLCMAGAFAEVADGLQHAHAKGVVHRDLKPSNLILDGGKGPGAAAAAGGSFHTLEGRLRILDFGLARLEGQEGLTATGDLLGTPQYMSPEQARRQKVPVDHRTDIYSLGATLYELLAWRPPFRGKDREDTLSQIIERDPVAPRKVNPRVPRDLETIVLKCLRKDPEDRYRTAEALAQDLRRFVRGDPVEARPERRWERLLRRLAREKLRLLVAAGAAVLLLASGLLAWRLAVETGKQRSREYERTVVEAAMKLLRGETLHAGVQGSPVEGGSFLFAEHLEGLGETGRAAVEQALADLDRALALLPERFEARYHRGRALLLLGRRPEAVREVDEALRQRPGFAPALVLRAEALGEGEEPALAGDPRGEAWSRARRALRRRRFDEAAAAYGELIALEESSGELYPGSGIAHLLARGMARLHAGDPEEAILDFWAARTLARASWGELLEPHLLLGMAYFLRGGAGDLERADAHLREALSLSGSREEGDLWAAAAYSSLVWERLDVGRIPDAVEAGRRAVKLRPGDLRTRIQLGWTLLWEVWARGEWGRTEGGEGDGERRELLEVSREVLEMDPRSPLAHRLMARALEAIGRGDEAREHAARAAEILAESSAETLEGRSDMSPRGEKLAATTAALVLALGAAGRAQEGEFVDVRPVEGPGINTPGFDTAPHISSDGRELIFASGRPGTGWLDLFVATRSAREEPFQDVRPLSELNTPDWEGGASLSADGLTLYFMRGLEQGDIWVAHRDRRWDDEGRWVPFVDPMPVPVVNSASQELPAEISADGLELVFGSRRPGGAGGIDIWVARRERDEPGEPFGEPEPVAGVNTRYHEAFPSLSADGRWLFFSGTICESGNRPVEGLGAPNIWAAMREGPGAEFGPPFPLPAPVNTDLPEHYPAISDDWPEDGAVLYFVPCFGCDPAWDCDIYQATWRLTCSADPGTRARFTVSPGADGGTILDATSSTPEDGIVSYQWRVGGEMAGEGPELLLVEPGRYEVTLRVETEAGSCDSHTELVDVSCPSGDVAPWAVADIGEPEYPGAARLIAPDGSGEPGGLALCAGPYRAGADGWFFVHQETGGDFRLAAGVAEFAGEEQGSLVALLARASLDPDAAFAAAVLALRSDGTFGLRFRYRAVQGGTVRNLTPSAVVEDPRVSLRLERHGRTFVGEYSLDGESWAELGRQELEAPQVFQVGIGAGEQWSVSLPVPSEFEALGVRLSGLELESLPFVFLRGDCDGTGKLEGSVNDAIANFEHCFRGREVPCRAACDADGDGNPCTGVTDGIAILNHLFRGGRPLAAPFPECGSSELLSDSELGCEQSGCSS